MSTISSASASAGLGAPHAHPYHQHFVDFTEALRPELLAEQLGRVLRGESVDVVVPQPQVPDYAGTGTHPGFRMVSPEERQGSGTRSDSNAARTRTRLLLPRRQRDGAVLRRPGVR